MAKNFEAPAGEKGESRVVRAYKAWNKISAAALAAAGVIFESTTAFVLAGVDIAQNALINRAQEWWKKRKVSKTLGKTATAGANPHWHPLAA
jgi:hypothetical protein